MGRIAEIKENDVTNGEGVRVSIWLQGCDLKCKGCHNYSIWNFNDGYEYTEEVLNKIIISLNKNNINRNLSILGGESLHPINIDTTLDIIKHVKLIYPDVNIWLWTGYKFENLNSDKQKIALRYIDVLIDGQFEIDKKDLKLKYRGSSNQRIIDVKESLKNNKTIELKY